MALPIPFRVGRDASRSERGRAPNETQCAPAIREIAVHRANDQTAGTPATALPAQRPRRRHRCATRRAPRDKRAARIPQGALQIRAVWPTALPLGSSAPPRRALAGSEPAPALVLTREPKSLALPIHLLDAALHSTVRPQRPVPQIANPNANSAGKRPVHK